MSDIPALDELAARFDEAIAKTSTRKAPHTPTGRLVATPVRRRVLAAAVVAAIATATFVAGSYRSPERAVAGAPLSLVDGKLAVSYQQVLDHPGDVEDQLASAGVHVSIREAAMSPSLVGKVRWSGGVLPIGDDVTEHEPQPWVVPSCNDSRVCVPWWPDGILQTGPAQGYEAGLLIPLDFDGETEILVGRPAKADEVYEIQQSPFAPGELLGCKQVELRTVAEARSVLADVDAPIVWSESGIPGSLGKEIDADGDGYIDDFDAAGQLVVDDAAYLNDHTILLTVRLAHPPDLTDEQIQMQEAQVATQRAAAAHAC
jgi:hypothetical protein